MRDKLGQGDPIDPSVASAPISLPLPSLSSNASMPPARGSKPKKSYPTLAAGVILAPGPFSPKEQLLQRGVRYFRGHSESAKKPTFADVVRLFGVNPSTLRRRILGLNQCYKDAHEKEQILTFGEETVLLDWINYLAVGGLPECRRTIQARV